MQGNRLIIIILVVLGLLFVSYLSFSFFAVAGRKAGGPLPKGNIEIPVKRTIQYNKTSQIQKDVIDYWAKGKVSDWVDGEKINLKNPRTVLGCLLAGKRVEEIKQYLLQQKTTGNEG